MKAITLDDVIQEQKKDPEFAKAYEREELINAIAKMVVKARKQVHLTQNEFASRVGTSQPVLARLESGKDSRIPSLRLLLRIADAADMHLNIQFTPVRH